jgi:nitrogen fixation protein FixH
MTGPAAPIAPAPRPFTGRHMLFLMLGFFGIVLAANVTMATFSSITWTGLVVDNSYVASQEFQEKLDALHRQQALGWHAVLTYTAGAARLVIVDGGGNPVDLGPVTLQINRPIGAKDDRTIVLERSPAGGYAAVLDLAQGAWDAVVTAPETETGPFELHERIKVEVD